MADLYTLFFGLLFVLVVIVGCAWLIKRMGGIPGANNNSIKVLAVNSVGLARERIALVDVGGQQLLLRDYTAADQYSSYLPGAGYFRQPKEENNSEFAQKLHQLMSRK